MSTTDAPEQKTENGMFFEAAKKPIKTKHERLGEMSVTVEYPQFRTVESLTQFLGGSENLLEFGNSAIAAGAKNVARAALANASETATKDEVILNAQKAAKSYVPSIGQEKGVSGKEAKERVNKAVEALKSGKQFTREELLAMLEGAAA